jgi:hypothetical protein
LDAVDFDVLAAADGYGIGGLVFSFGSGVEVSSQFSVLGFQW